MKKTSFLLAICLFINFCAVASQGKSTSEIETLPPHILVIFGATGDLTKLKLIPALVNLKRKGHLPDEFVCIGIGRRELSLVQYHNEIGSFVAKEDKELWNSFQDRMLYLSGNFDNEETYLRLGLLMQKLEREKGTIGNRLFYLATPPANFETIVKKLDQSGLLTDSGISPDKWSRVIIEKPFGNDLASAIHLKKVLTQHLEDSQIYLIDHYLGKEVVHNLLTFRFANPAIESFWNNQQIDHVSITLSEDIGVGTRGTFCEQTGLLRDLVQNHVMQLVSLVGMEKPKSFAAEDVIKEKLKLLQSIRPFQLDKLENQIIRGQYGNGKLIEAEVPGYRQEKGVAPDSTVETFVAAKLFIDNKRWSGVPFYIKAGKRLSKKLTEISIAFKPGQMPASTFYNELVLRIQPEEEIYLKINMRVPGYSGKIDTHKLSLPLHTAYGKSMPEAYERLLQEAMKGSHANFVSFEEHLASWQLFSPVLQHWKQNPPSDFPNYTAGTDGPKGSILLLFKE